MNYLLKRMRQPKADLKELLLPRASRCQVRRFPDVANRLPGGGLGSFSLRVLTKLLDRAMKQAVLKTLWRAVLQRFPNFSALLHRFATASSAVSAARMSASSWPSLPQLADPLVLVNSLYKAAFGRLADEVGLTHFIHQLQSGASQQAVAEGLVRSAEFKARHGSSEKLDIQFLTTLYRDGLGRQPDLQSLAFWLEQEDKRA